MTAGAVVPWTVRSGGTKYGYWAMAHSQKRKRLALWTLWLETTRLTPGFGRPGTSAGVGSADAQ